MKRNFFRQLIFVILLSPLFFVSCNKENSEDTPETPEKLENSTYSGTGSPLFDAPSSFTGKFVVNEELINETYYTITNWANKTLVFLDYKNGKFYLDGTTVLFEYDNLYWCMGVSTSDEWGNVHIQPASFEYEVKYNSSTKTFDFSGTLNNQPVVVGLVGRDKVTGEALSFSGDTFYSDAKLVLTPIPKSVSAKTQDFENFLKPTKNFN